MFRNKFIYFESDEKKRKKTLESKRKFQMRPIVIIEESDLALSFIIIKIIAFILLIYLMFSFN